LLALLQSGLRTARFAERTFFSPRQFFAALVAKHNFKLLNFSRISGFVNCRQINKTAPFKNARCRAERGEEFEKRTHHSKKARHTVV